MKGLVYSLASLIVCLTTTSMPLAQPQQRAPVSDRAPVEPSQTDGDDQFLLEHALALLDQALIQVREMPDAAHRVRSYIAITEALWEHDQLRAREVLRIAWTEIHHAWQPNENHSASSKRQADQLVAELLRRISRLDPAWASELARSITHPDKTEAHQVPESSSGPPQPPSAQPAEALLTLAFSLIESDPDRAIRLAAESLSQGVTPGFVLFLMQVRKPDEVHRLYEMALATALRPTTSSLRQLVLLGSYVLPRSPLPIQLSSSAAQSQVDPAQAGRYLSLLLEVLVRIQQSPGPADAQPDPLLTPAARYSLLQQLHPLVARYTPENLILVEALSQDLSRQIVPRKQQTIETGLSLRTGDAEQRVEILLSQAERATAAKQRDGFFAQAAVMAVKADEIDRAVEILSRLSDKKIRRQLAELIYYEAAMRALRKGDSEMAHRYALKLENPEHLIIGLLSITRKILERNAEDAARAMLDEAERHLGKLEPTAEKGRLLVRVAEVMTGVNPSRAFEILHLAILILNQTDAGLQADPPKITVTAEGFNTTRILASADLAPTVEKIMGSLGSSDFDRALVLAAQWKRAEIRVVAEIAVAQAVLREIKQKTASPLLRDP